MLLSGSLLAVYQTVWPRKLRFPDHENLLISAPEGNLLKTCSDWPFGARKLTRWMRGLISFHTALFGDVSSFTKLYIGVESRVECSDFIHMNSLVVSWVAQSGPL